MRQFLVFLLVMMIAKIVFGQAAASKNQTPNGEIMASWQAAVRLEPTRPHKLRAVNAHQLKPMVGEYGLPFHDDLTLRITVEGQHLRVEQLWNHFTYTLYAASDNTFFVNEYGHTFVFRVASDGTILGALHEENQWVKVH